MKVTTPIIMFSVLVLFINACSVTNTSVNTSKLRPQNEVSLQTRSHIALARKYLQLLRYSNAIFHAESALALSPNSIMVQKVLAFVYWQSGIVELAVNIYSDVLSSKSDDWEANDAFATLLCQTQMSDERIQILFDNALIYAPSPNVPKIYENIGHCAHLRGKLKTAIKYFLLAKKTDLNISASKYHIFIAELFLDLNQLDDARRSLSTYYKAGGRAATAYTLSLSIAKLTNNQHELALYHELLNN